jgi:hypothetical protein
MRLLSKGAVYTGQAVSFVDLASLTWICASDASVSSRKRAV